MTRHRAVLRVAILAGMAVVCLAPVSVLCLPARPRLCRATFERVKVGMTCEQVWSTVGCAPGHYAEGVLVAPRSIWDWGEETWVCSECELAVWYDSEGRVSQLHVWNVMHFSQPTLLQRIREWLGL
jgi:hypothetical protein